MEQKDLYTYTAQYQDLMNMKKYCIYEILFKHLGNVLF